MQTTTLPPTTCSTCRLRDVCMPVGLTSQQMAQIDHMVSTRVKVPRGRLLFRAGGQFKSLYSVRTGFFKTTIGTSDGREQVTGFYMSGELLGLDGIVQSQYTCNARALEDADVCVLHMHELNDLMAYVPPLQQHLQKIMSREIVQEHDHLFLLGSMQAQARVASFLLNLLHRLHQRGQAANELLLRMTREEMGSYLGLTIETVSRTLSKLAKSGVIAVDQRHIRVLQSQALHDLAEHIHVTSCESS
jgi:CRP/FNR family transcriptional regulator, anaerobic regulatory protein